MAPLLLLLSAFLTFGLQITGAQQVEAGEVKYQAVIYELGKFKCGGSIINRKSILTAASCVPNKADPFAYTVIVGDVNMGVTDGIEQAHVPIEIIHKEEYNGSYASDIALLILSTSIDFNKYVDEIRISQPGSSWYYNNPAVTITGWGGGTVLQKEPGTVSKNKTDCLEAANLNYVLCVQSPACSKDHGVPLISTQTGETVQIGISLNPPVNCTGTPTKTIFTEIAPYTTWIDSKIGDLDTGGKGHMTKFNKVLMVLAASVIILFSC